MNEAEKSPQADLTSLAGLGFGDKNRSPIGPACLHDCDLVLASWQAAPESLLRLLTRQSFAPAAAASEIYD